MATDIFEKVIENPLFFRWVFRTNKEVDAYWNQYMEQNPDEAEALKRLKKRMEFFRYDMPDQLSEIERKSLSARILSDLEQEDMRRKRHRVLVSFLRYAAVAVLFSVVSGLLVYWQMSGVKPDLYVQGMPVSDQLKEPTLIYSNGQNISLHKSQSTVDYTADGKIVVNNDEVIQTEHKSEEPVINQLVIPYGNRSKVRLSDSTTVWLNAGSRLVYPSSFTGSTREVRLFGEAYFEVAKDKSKPFIVKTQALDIRVLGTKFNVSAYSEDNVVQTVLKEGSVALRRNGAGFFEKDVLLKPNQMAMFSKETQESKVVAVDPSYYTLWVQGLISFDDVELNRIVKRLERFYNIRVSYENPLTGGSKITGKLDLNQSVEEVFEYLAKVSSVHVEKTGEKQYMIKE